MDESAEEERSLRGSVFYVKTRYPRLCLEVMEIIGSWPSSEPELSMLQRVWP